MAFLCKKCKKAFRKDMSVYEESDEYCPYCDNHYVRLSSSLPLFLSRYVGLMSGGQIVDAKIPKARVQIEGEDVRVDSRSVLPVLLPSLQD
jgi:hypothetical protein